MVGYLDNPEATAQAMAGDWYKTGDLSPKSTRTATSFIVETELKDAIVTGGENVYCKEVEDVMAEVPAIAQCAVVGLPHPGNGASRRRRRGA